MPLSKLFHRRSSTQKDRKSSLTPSPDPSPNVESGKFFPKASSSSESDPLKVESKPPLNPDKMNLGSEKTVVDEKVVESKDSNANPELDDSNDGMCNMQDATNRRYSVPNPEEFKKSVRSKTRSHSCREGEIVVPKTRRRKCESESAASTSTDDEGFEDKIIQLRERDLEKVIGQCVNKLIRESILTAVKNVTVEDVLKSISRSSSESSETDGYPETVEQKLHSGSVSEYANVEMIHSFEEASSENQVSDEIDGCPLAKNPKESVESSNSIHPQNSMIDTVLTGDQLEDNLKAETDTSSQINESSMGQESFAATAENPESRTPDEIDGCVLKRDVIDISESTNDQSSVIEKNTILNNYLTETLKDNLQKGPNEPETVLKVDETCHESSTVKEDLKNIKQQEYENSNAIKHLEDGEQEKVDKEDDAIVQPPRETHSFEEDDSKENRSVKKSDDINCLKGEFVETDVKNLVEDITMKVEAEFSRETAMDGYQADIEESASIHSIASESSCENVKVKVCPETSTVTDEGGMGKDEKCEEKAISQQQVESVQENEKPKKSLGVESDLMAMSGDDFSHLLSPTPESPAVDLGENLPEQKQSPEEEKKVNWKVGYLHVKLPHKTRNKGHLKVWKKRCVAIQLDEFANDPANPCLVLSVYSGDSVAARKHSASFWKSVSCQKAVIYRSSSRTHPYSFTVSDDQKAVVHLAGDSEAITQEWMAAIRAILWPPSPVVQLEKMLNGRQFEISLIDNEFSYHAGLLGMYGYMTITPKKLTLVHPQQGYVIQEWYLNTVDKFQLMQQTRIEDVNKVLSMTTCSDSSTGKGDLLIFCKEAVGLLQAIATTIHQILSHHSSQEGGGYQKELEEIGAWLVPDTPSSPAEDYYKVPPRQVKSLLDIPNFIFDKPLTPVATFAGSTGAAMDASEPSLDVPKTILTSASEESSELISGDILNCSVTSFVVGGGNFPGKSSDSELSDAYTPPRSPEVKTKREPEAATET
ncbi:PH domain-containing protein [Caerostris extrusa]|uniref:PH domain-containing protein n=1 Tax=Caerostris extrusa TaxID=172846 RepID=A0AAV4U5J4_CAEEX|nr:PH domain-containing protein [Caerostris extrusa]